ncbi:MAG: dihydrofolate reductase [Alistipes sp.]|jgi:dihydrofolate reductase|uniref:dihydrofolate reductase n=1 Tax=Alistipes sp. TaxID=1872444 RepID=UPI003995DC35
MITLVAAVAENGVIGAGNRVPWYLKEDLQRFRALTLGHGVVMGRKTWESLGGPLPGRRNVVVSRQELRPEGAEAVRSLEAAVALFPPDEELFVIGGAQLFRQALPLADRMLLTRIRRPYPGDAYFPEWDEAAWRLTASEARAGGPDFPWPYAFQTWERKK